MPLTLLLHCNVYMCSKDNLFLLRTIIFKTITLETITMLEKLSNYATFKCKAVSGTWQANDNSLQDNCSSIILTQHGKRYPRGGGGNLIPNS